MAAPPVTRLTREQRHELTQSLATLFDHTETVTERAARRGVCSETVRRQIERGEIEKIILGRDVRVWRDA